VPVNLKPIHARDEELGNYFGLGFVELPVGEPDFGSRIEHIKDHTSALKQGTQAYLIPCRIRLERESMVKAHGFSRGLAYARAVREHVDGDRHQRPGTGRDFTFCGETVEDFFFWVPQSAGVALGLCIFTYAGHLRVGIAADRDILEDPFDLARAFQGELATITEDIEAAAEH